MGLDENMIKQGIIRNAKTEYDSKLGHYWYYGVNSSTCFELIVNREDGYHCVYDCDDNLTEEEIMYKLTK